jgi:hypothetical protein
MEKDKSFVGGRKLVLSEEQLKDVRFAAISPAARKILKNSSFFYKDALLTAEPKEYQKAALDLAKTFFTVK